MHSRFTDLQKTEIIAQYWRGKPVTKICEEYAVSKSTVYAWVRPYLVKKEAEAVGRQVFIQKEMINLQNKMCRLNTIIEILGKAECLRNSPLEERLAEFQRLKGQYGTNILLEALNISKGTYHSRILHNDTPSARRERYEYIKTYSKNEWILPLVSFLLAFFRMSGLLPEIKKTLYPLWYSVKVLLIWMNFTAVMPE